jgi:hypothetical protein
VRAEEDDGAIRRRPTHAAARQQRVGAGMAGQGGDDARESDAGCRIRIEGVIEDDDGTPQIIGHDHSHNRFRFSREY